MKIRQASLFALIIGVVLCLAQTASAGTVDIWADFPDTQGVNGLYARAYNPSSASYRDLTDIGTRAFGSLNQYANIPFIKQDAGSGWLVAHPSSYPIQGSVYGAEDAILEYIIPESGNYDISCQFKLGDKGSVAVYLRDDDYTFQSGTINNYGATSFSVYRYFSANDKLRFGVSPAGSDAFDSTCLKGTISLIPEPASLSLLGLGLFGLLRLRSRKR